jgi:hypothetical protein
MTPLNNGTQRTKKEKTMKNKWFKRILLGALFFFAGTTQALEYNLTSDFSTNNNPNGVWSYGATKADFSDFSISPWNTSLKAWTETNDQANIWINDDSSTKYGIPVGKVALHPGTVSPGIPAVIRWTAPCDVGEASIQISGTFGAGDSGQPTVAIRNGTNSIWSAINSGTFNETTTVIPGNTIDFCVYGVYSYANTELDATIEVISSKPYLSKQPRSLHADTNKLVSFSVSACASSGTVSYLWIKNSTPLQDGDRITGANFNRLVISPTQLSDAGDYTVIVTDSSGNSTTSSIATLSFGLSLPSITTEPVDSSVSSGANASFSVTANDADTYQWYCKETAIKNGGIFSGATTSTLQINTTHQTNNAVYSVRISNARGTVFSRAARLTVTTGTSDLNNAVDNNNILIENPGDWSLQTSHTHDGIDAAQSKPISSGQSTEMNASLCGPGELNFLWSVSSETCCDFLSFYFDNIRENYISGEPSEWASITRFIPENSHKIAWIYNKDGSNNGGLDAGFVDQLIFTPYLLSSVDEAVDGLPGPITFGDGNRWYGQASTTHDGTDAARAPLVNDSQSAWFETTVTGPGRVIFWTKTSSETACDFMHFRVDGTSVYHLDGVSDWQATTNWIDWGKHTLRWSYEKDASKSYFDDTAWVDQISYTPVTMSSLSEAADSSGITWTTDPSAPWFGQDRFTDDGIDAIQSGKIGDNQETWVKGIVAGPGSLSFRWKSLCENPDYVRFFINGSEKANKSGDNDWSDYSINIPEGGDVELMWKYEKDSSAVALEDAVWIDKVVFTPQSTPVTLTIAPSPHGTLLPAAGTYTTNNGTIITLSAIDTTSGSSQYKCLGWTGTGSVPTTGTSNAVTVTLQEDSSIAWNWQTNYWLEVSVTGSGSVDHDSNWYEKDTEQILTATPDAGWLFMGWSGAASGTNKAFVMITEPLSITATFSDDADDDGLSNTEETTYGSDPWKSDTDGDGFDDGFEVQKGLSPTNDDSDVATYIQNHDSSFGLYPSNVVLDVAFGQILLETASGNANLNLQLEQSEDLQSWTNAGDAVEWILPVGSEKKFFRVRSEK